MMTLLIASACTIAFLGREHIKFAYAQWRFRTQIRDLYGEENFDRSFTGQTSDFFSNTSTRHEVIEGWTFDNRYQVVFATLRDDAGLEHFAVVGCRAIRIGESGHPYLDIYAVAFPVNTQSPSDLPLWQDAFERFELGENSVIAIGPSSLTRGPPDVVSIPGIIDGAPFGVKVGVGTDGRAWMTGVGQSPKRAKPTDTRPSEAVH